MHEDYGVLPASFGDPVATKQGALLLTLKQHRIHGQIGLPNITHPKPPASSSRVKSCAETVAMHGDVIPEVANTRLPEEERTYDSMRLGRCGQLMVFDGQHPVPRFTMETIAIAVKGCKCDQDCNCGYNRDEHGDWDTIKVLDVDDHANMHGLDASERKMLRNTTSLTIESIFKRTPTSGVATAIVYSVMDQIATENFSSATSSKTGRSTIDHVNSTNCSSVSWTEHHISNPTWECIMCAIMPMAGDEDEPTEDPSNDVDIADVTIEESEIREAQGEDSYIRTLRSLIDARTSLDDARDKSDKGMEQRAMATYKKLTKSAGKKVSGQASSCYLDEDGLVYYADANKQLPVPVITKELGIKAVTMAHGQMLTVHIGIQRCNEFIRLRYWWKGMKKDIEDHVRHCLPCQKAKFESQPGAGFSHLRFYLGPGQSIAIDIVVLNHASTMGTKYFFTILDCFSHWPEAIPMKDMEAETCAKALWQWIRNHGVPIDIRSDRGANLNLSLIFTELYKILKIKGIVNAAFSPQSNQVERLHKWLGAALRLMFAERDMEVEEMAEVAMFIYRATPNVTTKFTPFMLNTGREARLPTDIIDESRIETLQSEYAGHLSEILPMIYKKAIAARMEAQEVQADYYNEHHGVVSDIVTGDLVFCEVHNYNTSEMPTKLLPKCSGPWKVLKISSKGAYISHVTSGVEKPASLRHLKKVRLTSEQMQQLEDREFYHDAEVMGQLPGRFVIVSANKIGFNIGKLVSTLDDYVSWSIQWYNIKDAGVTGKSRVGVEYLPCWTDRDSGNEIRQRVQPANSDPMLATVKRKRFIGDTFDMSASRKLPSTTCATLRGKFPKAKLSF